MNMHSLFKYFLLTILLTSSFITAQDTYSTENRDGSISVTISGSSWRSKMVIKSGFGEAYDNQNAEYSRGIVNGNDLYDESGYIKIGSVSGNRVIYSGLTLNKSSNKSSSSSYTKKKATSINGTYSTENRDGSISVTISGSSWRSKMVIKSGFGEAYDNQNAEYSRGIVNGNDLYDESGYIKIGSVSGNRVIYSGLTLNK